MARKQRLHVDLAQAIIGVVCGHFDLLYDDAALLLHGFFREVGRKGHSEQDAQGLRLLLAGLNVVTGEVVGGVGVSACADRRKQCVGAALRHVKELVLQIMRDALRHLDELTVPGVAAIHGAAVDQEDGVELRKVGLVDRPDAQTAGKRRPVEGLAQAGIIHFVHSAAPFRKNTVSSRTVRAAAATSSAVTASTAAVRSATVARMGPTASPR